MHAQTDWAYKYLPYMCVCMCVYVHIYKPAAKNDCMHIQVVTNEMQHNNVHATA